MRVDVSLEYNELLHSLGSQCSECRYYRYCLFAKTENVSEYKLHGVFWDIFLLEMLTNRSYPFLNEDKHEKHLKYRK